MLTKYVVYVNFVLFLFPIMVYGQNETKFSTSNKKAIDQYKNGELYYLQEKYGTALEWFEMAKRSDPAFVEAYFMCAEIYRDLDNYMQTYENIKTGVGLDSTIFVSAYYQAGVALCHMARFDEAMEWFDLYKRFSEGKRSKYDPTEWIERAMFAKNLMENPVPFHPEPMPKILQCDYDIYWPSLTLDEEEICFTVLCPRDSDEYQRDPLMPVNSQNFHEDFFTSRKSEGEWQELTPANGINTYGNEGAQALSPDGKWMFFTACGRPDSKGSCDLYFSQKTPNGWSKPVNIGAPVNSPYWESQPCFSADGQTLLFVSNRPGGKGKNDIWAARLTAYREDGMPIFGKIVNMGDSINTSGDEVSPFIHPDNKTLYFSSDGWPGVGKQDIFVSRKDSTGKWGKPTNLGYPINTSQDDNGLIVNASGTTAYYASARFKENGYQKREIMYFDLPEQARPTPVSYIKGFVYDVKTNVPLGAALELIDLATGRCIVRSKSEPQKGTFVVNLPFGKDYALIANKEGYLLYSQNFGLHDEEATSKAVRLDIPLSPLIPGEKVALRNVFFDYNSTDLKQESFIELDRLVQIMKDNPKIRIEIGGHTDSDGSATYNMRLSLGRASSTVNYLISKGIDSSRIESQGYGLTQPIADNSTDEGKALNRRIEAKIIE